MALKLTSVVIFAFAVSTVLGDEISETKTALLVEAARAMDDVVAIYSSINDAREKCLTATRAVFEPEKLFAVYVLHYQGEDGQPGADIPYCVNLTATDSWEYDFGACKEGQNSTRAQAYYYSENICFLARFPLPDTAHCLLWVHTGYENSVPKDCQQAFEQYCGRKKYTLYKKAQCS